MQPCRNQDDVEPEQQREYDDRHMLVGNFYERNDANRFVDGLQQKY